MIETGVIERYGYLFVLALMGAIFGSIQDLRKREVSNWLNFSLIAFALAYRAFYSAINKEIMFFIYGLIGFGIFFGLAYGFYYARVFAGGDAKLLMGIGVVLPFESFVNLAFIGIGFLFVLFFIGAIYSLVYSLFIIKGNWGKFRKEFIGSWKIGSYLVLVAVFLSLILLIFIKGVFWFIIAGYMIFISFLYTYLKALDKCMIKLTDARDLTEGDWLEQNVKIKGKVVRKSVHGLSLEDIKLIRKAGKRVLIKQGIPFVPVFLIALIVVIVFYFKGIDLRGLLGLFYIN